MRVVELAYGKSSLQIAVPEEMTRDECILSARTPAPADAERLYAEAARAGLPRLAGRVALVVPDATRPAAHSAAFRALAPLLSGASVTVVVGAGLHPPDRVEAPWPATVHDASAPDAVDMGEADGIPVRLHPEVAHADAVLVVGVTMPHYLAGFSGGAKGIVPGVAARETILAVHRRADASRNGVVEGNPFAAAIRRCASLLAIPAWSLNLLVGPRGPFAATAGPLEEAHRRAVELYRRECAVPRPEPGDLVVADAGGDPVDATLLQSHKAYEGAFALVRPGGTILLVAACGRGYGHAEFERRLRAADPLAGEFHPYARTAAEWRRKAAATRTLMVTEMDVRGLGVTKTTLPKAFAQVPRGTRVLWAHGAQDLLFL